MSAVRYDTVMGNVDFNILAGLPAEEDLSEGKVINSKDTTLEVAMKISSSRKAAIFCELYRMSEDILKELCAQGSAISDTHPELSYETINGLTYNKILEDYLADYITQVRAMFRSGFGSWTPVVAFISDRDLDIVFASAYRQYLLNARTNGSSSPVIFKTVKSSRDSTELQPMELGI